MNIFLKKTKFLYFIVIPIFLFVSIGVVYALGTWSTGYRINTETKSVYVGSEETCHSVTNTSGNSYFIPTKTTTEYNAFVANLPSGLTIGSCFDYIAYTTPGSYTFTVPSTGTYKLEAWGGQGQKGGKGANGGNRGGDGGKGGYVYGNITLTNGQILYINVGSGGGMAGSNTWGYGGAGGGASDIRSGGTALSNRIIVAGGGGGGGGGYNSYPCGTGGRGGAGGGSGYGGNGGRNGYCSNTPGTAGGAGGTGSSHGGIGLDQGDSYCADGSTGNNGTLGVGGSSSYGGHGGDGYYGGGAGASYSGGYACGNGGGGGGSSYVGNLSNTGSQSGVRSGSGSVVITLQK